MPAIASVATAIVLKVVGMRLFQVTHIAHVLLSRHRMDDRTRSEEQERLEERMRKHVEDAPP